MPRPWTIVHAPIMRAMAIPADFRAFPMDKMTASATSRPVITGSASANGRTRADRPETGHPWGSLGRIDIQPYPFFPRPSLRGEGRGKRHEWRSALGFFPVAVRGPRYAWSRRSDVPGQQRSAIMTNL